MRLDPEMISVESFPTTALAAPSDTSDTGPGGPPSYCYICRPTDPTAPSCDAKCDAVEPYV